MKIQALLQREKGRVRDVLNIWRETLNRPGLYLNQIIHR